jgi:hypothetical protein
MTRHVFGSIDDKFAEYAVQMITSTGDIYWKYIYPLNVSYAKKVFNKSYDPARAIIGYINIVEAVLPQVKREYAEYYEISPTVIRVSRETKETIARELHYEYEELLQNLVDDIAGRMKKRVTPKKRQKKVRK